MGKLLVLRRQISPIPVYHLPRLFSIFQAGKRKKQKIPHKNNYGCGLCRWHSTFGIGLYDKMEYVCFNQRGDISSLNGWPLKLVDKFTYLGSSVSSTKKDINTWQAKAWTAIDRLLVIWKSNLTDEIKCSFFQVVVVLMHYIDAN